MKQESRLELRSQGRALREVKGTAKVGHKRTNKRHLPSIKCLLMAQVIRFNFSFSYWVMIRDFH